MARVTIEDCLEKVDDRFELVALAAQRARNIANGAAITIERKGEKDTVISLREIAESTVDVGVLKENLTKSFQKERDSFEDFVAPQQTGTTGQASDMDIDAEEADIRAAIAEASEAGIDQGEELDGFSTGASEQIFAGDNIDAKD